MAKITVVMPAYNAAKYIKEAIDSVLNQTFLDWELIIVDDCSTDSTYSIILQYELQDSRIRVYKMPQNSGSAFLPRKKAVSEATSEWISSLDADDYYEPYFLEKLYNRILETKADIVFQRMICITDGGEVIDTIPKSNFDMSQILTGEEACMLTINGWDIGCNGGGMHRTVYEKVWARYHDSYIGMNADELLTRKRLLCADKVAFSDGKYFYRKNMQSITNSFSTKLFDILQTNILLKDIIVQHFGEISSESIKMEQQMFGGVLSCAVLYCNYRCNIPIAERNTIRNKLKQSWTNLDWACLKPYLPFWRYFLFHVNFEMMMFLIEIYQYAKRKK